MRYFITFACYGAHLHGAASGSVDRRHILFQGRFVAPNPRRESLELERMRQPPYMLDQDARTVALEALREVCECRGWALLAAHVRTYHVHVVAQAEDPPRASHDWLQVLRQPRVKSPGSRRRESPALGPSWKYPPVVEGPGPAGSDPLCRP